jgi:hypothetical protein
VLRVRFQQVTTGALQVLNHTLCTAFQVQIVEMEP